MIVAAVPVRSIHDGKRRLRIDDRAALAAHMLMHVLDTLASARCISRVAVISADPAALELAARHGAVGLLQASAGLNAACRDAAAWASRESATALLLAHADLPRLTAESVNEMVMRACRSGASVVLGPDRHGSGTNLLLATPPNIIPFAFGVGSRFRHRALAQRAKVPVIEYVSSATACDVDTADDLAETLPMSQAWTARGA